jgi:16S rRNA C967 or C1407 C5-methylase (RsmB/RsmF family)
MLSAEREERVLDICAGGGTGKSYLLRRMWQECSAQDVPCALAEFASTWQPDPTKLMRELAERLGVAHFPTFRQQEERSRSAPARGGDAASLRE